MVTTTVSNFNLVDKLGGPKAPNQGHIHYFLDATPPIAPGIPAVTAPDTYVSIAATSYTWPNVQAGTRTFSAELVNDDHTPLEPPVLGRVTVAVTTTSKP